MPTEEEQAELTAAVARLEAVLTPTGMPRTRALLDRARDLGAGLPIGMDTPGLVELITRASEELEANPQ